MAKKKTKAIVKKEDKKNLVWAGAKALLKKPENQKEADERRMILLASKVLNVSPFGVNILGNLPYINKLGLTQKANQYQPGVRFIYDWLAWSKDDVEKAVCKCKVIGDKGVELTDWIIGECSPGTIKMSTLKGYQNHMAQTRAKNRAILEAFGVKIHEEMMSNVAKLAQKEEITEQEAAKIGEVVTTSVEEIQLPLGNQKAPEATKNDKTSIKVVRVEELKGMLKGNNIAEKLADLKARTGINLGSFNISERHAGILVASLLNSEIKK